MIGNDVVCNKNCVPDKSMPIDVDFALLEKLPYTLRRIMWELSQPMLVADVKDVLVMRGMTFTMWALEEQERRELIRFANMYRQQTACGYPHLMAGASIQRYESGIPRRRRRKLRWMDMDSMRVPDVPRWYRR